LWRGLTLRSVEQLEEYNALLKDKRLSSLRGSVEGVNPPEAKDLRRNEEKSWSSIERQDSD
jgi:hypothetical protein